MSATFDLPAEAGAARDSAILAHATAGDLDIAWVPLSITENDHTIEILVTPDAVKLGNVRINVSAYLQQQLADAFGALLFTPKVADLHFLARTVTIPPFPIPITSSTAGMQTESQKMEDAVAAEGGRPNGGIVGTVGKHWVLTNGLNTHPGMACNYGWYLPLGTKSPWNGVGIYPSNTLRALLIQQPGYAHASSHVDYSQQANFMHRDCKVDGQPRDLASVLTDPSLASLVSTEGPITVPGCRQPGVPLFSCPLPKKTMATLVQPSDMCPTPPPPKIESTGIDWTMVGITGAAIVAVCAGFAWVVRRPIPTL